MATDPHHALVRSLLAPGRHACGLVAAALATTLACAIHSIASNRLAEQDAALALVRRLALSDLALVPDEDLRHPGWARAEQGRAGQPSLPDPRGSKTLVHPVPMKVNP